MMQTASQSGTLETLDNALDNDRDTVDTTNKSKFSKKSKMVQLCKFIQSFTGKEIEAAEYTLKCLKVLSNSEEPLKSKVIHKKAGIALNPQEKTYVNRYLKKFNENQIVIKPKTDNYLLCDEYKNLTKYIFDYIEKDLGEPSINNIYHHIEGSSRAFIANNDEHLSKLLNKRGPISTANAIDALLEPCIMYDTNITNNIVKDNLQIIIDTLEDLLDYQNENGGFPSGNDISVPTKFAERSMVDSTSEVGFAIYYGLKMIDSEKDNLNQIGKFADNLYEKFHQKLDNLLDWLTKQQNTDKGWGTFLDEYSRTLPTSITINLFYTLISDNDLNIKKLCIKYKLNNFINSGQKWLINKKQIGKGWGFSEGEKSNISSTSHALSALIPNNKHDKESVKWLLDNVDKWGETDLEVIQIQHRTIDRANVSYQRRTLATLIVLNLFNKEIFEKDNIKELIFNQITIIMNSMEEKDGYFYSKEDGEPSSIYSYLDGRCLMVYYCIYLIHRLVTPLVDLENNPTELIETYMIQPQKIRMPF